MSGHPLNAKRARTVPFELAWRSAGDSARELLIDACRVTPAAGRSREGTDWDWLLAEAATHAVAPLLARRLAAEPLGVPSHILATLRARFDQNALRNIQLTQQMGELLQRLAAHGVDAMPIKGPALAISAYGDLALREFADLDIVVRPRHFDNARTLLGECGYRPRTPLTSSGEETLRATDHHLPLVNDELGVMVELHWSLDNGRPGRVLDGEWVWANARTVSLLGSELPALSWSALLVYLCVHGAKHGWTRLGWIRDVAGVLSAAPAGELAATTRLAASAGARRRLALGVGLARSLLHAPARDDLELLADPEAERLGREVCSGLFGGGPAARAGWMAFQCRTFDRARDRVGYCWHILAAPHVSDVEAVALPRWLRWTYFLVRPARLLGTRLRALAQPRR